VGAQQPLARLTSRRQITLLYKEKTQRDSTKKIFLLEYQMITFRILAHGFRFAFAYTKYGGIKLPVGSTKLVLSYSENFLLEHHIIPSSAIGRFIRSPPPPFLGNRKKSALMAAF
jgi:hypothetical protein